MTLTEEQVETIETATQKALEREYDNIVEKVTEIVNDNLDNMGDAESDDIAGVVEAYCNEHIDID